MTWHRDSFISDVTHVATELCSRRRLARLSLAVWAACLAVACGTSSKNATIKITAPEKGQVLTFKDDLDDNKAGLQFNVTAASTDVAPGTDVILRIEGESDAPITKVGRDGLIEFENVTLPEGKRTLKVTTGNGGIQSPDDWDYTYKALVIESPQNGAALGFADDKDPDKQGVQISVTVKTYAIDLSEDVSLQIDNQTVGSPLHPNASGSLVFTGVTLENGDHTLKAIAGTAESEGVRVSVNPACAMAKFVTPMAPDDGSALVLGGGDKCPAQGDQFKTDFIVSTDAGEGRNVDLYVNGTLFSSTKVEGTVATFKDVVLDRYNTANQVQVVVQGVQNVTCDPVKYPVDIQLDCMGVDCSISAPQPVAGDDGNGNRVQYLNSSQKGSDGFQFEVHTDAQAVGRPVHLIIDGRETDAPSADPSGTDPDVKATFTGIQLDDGQHTIAARCEHTSGSVGFSHTATWIVDTQACGVQIQQPTADTLLVPGFDVDNNLSGVQVALESKLTGDDCNRARSAACDPSKGIASDVGYEMIDGKSPLRSIVTLANEANQTLCLDILDRAGNKSSDNVAVRYRPQAPKVLIETPSDGDKFNADGGSGYTKDSDPGSATVCNANFDVACSELGTTVELHRDDANGTVFAMGTCEAKAAGDPALPNGYAGRARVKNAAFLSGNNDTVTIVATQSTDSSNPDLIGESPAITLKGDCQAPGLKFSGADPCEGGQIGVSDANATVTKTVVVADSTSDTQMATLTVTETSGGNVSYMNDASINSGSYTFDMADLGGPGSGGSRAITLAVTVKDGYNNTGKVSCDTQIVFGLPTLMVATPSDNAVFTTVAPASPEVCAPSGGGTGIQIAATADSATGRSATVSVNGGADVALTVAGTAISGCVPVDPGANTLSFKLINDTTQATATVMRTISVVTAKPDTGITLNAPVLPADRSGKVTLSWTLPQEAYTGQFVSYQLHCSTLPLDLGAGEIWWNNARVVDLPADFKPPSNTVDLAMRVGEDANCQLRAADALGELTPLTASVSVNLKFREHRFAGTNSESVAGYSIAGVGDVNGDGIDDLLVGGLGAAYLVFGSTTGWSTNVPDVVFTGGSSSESTFGQFVAGIGDFNGDSRVDLAISESFKAAFPTPNAGRVYVFFGRTSGDAWPAAIDLTAGTGCGADLCFDAATRSFLGSGLSTAGDFDGDGTTDLAMGAPKYTDSSMQRIGRLYILLGGSQYQQGQTRSGDFYGITVPIESGSARRGFAINGSASVLSMGTAVASLGQFDSTAGMDLVVSAQGDGSSNGAVYYVSGRSYAGPEIVELSTSDLGIRDPSSGTPSGTPIDTAPGVFGAGLYALGNAYNVPGVTPTGAVDIAIWQFGATGFYLYPGDTNFAAADRVFVGAASGGASYFGESICTGADLDGDGLTEVCAAGELDLKTSMPPGTANLWYSDNFAAGVSGGQVLTDASTALNPALDGQLDTTPVNPVSTGMRIVNFVGDLNGDGKVDLVVGTPSSSNSTGEFAILY